MTVHDLWKGLSKEEVARRRQANRVRWQRRWRDGTGKDAPQRKQSYKEAQKAQAYIDDAAQMGKPKARDLVAGSITVNTLLDRHMATKTDRAPRTVETDGYRAQAVRDQFGDRVLSTIDGTEVETWARRPGVAPWSRKKQIEIFRAAVRRGIRDKLITDDPTEGISVSLGHKEKPHYTSDQLQAILANTANHLDDALLRTLGLMGIRAGEARALQVGDLRDGHLSVLNSGGGRDQTKTRSSRRVLPVPATVLPALQRLVDGRPKSEWMFPSPRKAGRAVAERYPGEALTRAVARANQGRDEPIERLHVHALRHTFAFIGLSELGMDLLTVSTAMGHSKPSTTLNEYGHWSPKNLGGLMAGIDSLMTGLDAGVNE